MSQVRFLEKWSKFLGIHHLFEQLKDEVKKLL